MPITNYTEYLSRLGENQTADFMMAAPFSSTVQRLAFGSRNFVPAITTPTTSVALDSTSAHALMNIPAVSTGRLSIMGANLSATLLGGAAVMLVDMLNVSGGLNGTLATEQTTNLPTAELTRYTSGDGVMAGICIWTTVGTGAASLTMRYTNQANVSNRVTTAVSFGSAERHTGRMYLMPLQSGDTGVRSVQGVTLSGTTGVIGDFGVCLFRPLAMLCLTEALTYQNFDAVSTGGFVGALAEVLPNACLSIFGVMNVAGAVSGSIILSEV